MLAGYSRRWPLTSRTLAAPLVLKLPSQSGLRSRGIGEVIGGFIHASGQPREEGRAPTTSLADTGALQRAEHVALVHA